MSAPQYITKYGCGGRHNYSKVNEVMCGPCKINTRTKNGRALTWLLPPYTVPDAECKVTAQHLKQKLIDNGVDYVNFVRVKNFAFYNKPDWPSKTMFCVITVYIF
jgi:hypothetical protein